MARSLLFTPGDAPAKMRKAATSGADAVILDLEDSVAPAAKPLARDQIALFLAESRQSRPVQLWVRINPLSTGLALEDLAKVVAGAPDGIVLPKAEGARDVRRLSDYLAALEIREGLAPGAIRILPIATETPRALFKLGTYEEAGDRLAGLTWGAEDLPTAVGASANRTQQGQLTDLCRLARTLCLAGAASAEVPAIETVYPAFADLDGLRLYAEQGRREGFSGMMAIHPNQVKVINQAFSPSADEIARAKRIVEAFASAPNAGVLVLDGAMVDAPHLKQAQRLLAESGHL